MGIGFLFAGYLMLVARYLIPDEETKNLILTHKIDLLTVYCLLLTGFWIPDAGNLKPVALLRDSEFRIIQTLSS